ncbi:cytochrome b/b6 domain-containing protein [Tateyamaria sp. SN6-1]|uniref:cytochrome b/b6 domain-containing protein n=1 Tax=Tateyamaria sp. SN6-1 TaxID=3092148 RepID=UPI0039F63C66
MQWPARRTALKWLHWLMVPLFVWFLIVTPDVVVPFGPTAFQVHSMLALVFVSLSLAWFADLLRRGLAGRPGPKLNGRLRRVHRAMHLTLIWGLFFVAFTGFLLGLTSHTLLKAGGFLPIAPPLGLRTANHIVGQVHIIQFYALGVVAAGHAGFHIWRHYRLRDNALRIMVPRKLHKYL